MESVIAARSPRPVFGGRQQRGTGGDIENEAYRHQHEKDQDDAPATTFTQPVRTDGFGIAGGNCHGKPV
jgi:hypothetical protein